MEYYTFLFFNSFLNSILHFIKKKKKSIDQTIFKEPNQKISKRIV